MSEPAQTEAAAAVAPPLDIVAIQQILPHRYPFLLIDRVTEIERKQRIVAIKNVTINEPFFAGHFPGHPIMPGVLMIEAMAQAGGTLLLTEIPDHRSKLILFTGIENARFRRPVVPGDQLRFEVSVLKWRRNLCWLDGKAYVGSELAAEATLSCAITARKPGQEVPTS